MKERVRGVPRGGVGYGALRYVSGEEGVRGAVGRVARAELCFNYAGRFDQMMAERDERWQPSGESVGTPYSPRATRAHMLTVTANVMGQQLRVNWTYSSKMYRRETIERVAENFIEALRQIIAHCDEAGSASFTPSDFPEAGLSQDELDNLLAEMSD